MATPASGHIFVYEGAQGNSWYAKLRLPDGKQRKRRLGSCSEMTERQAERALGALLADIDETWTGSTSISFKQIAEGWLEYIEHDRRRKRSTILNYQNIVNHSLLPRFDQPAETIEPSDVDDYRRDLLAQGLAATTVNKRLNVLSGIFALAGRNHGLSNPVEEIERQPHRTTGKIEVLEPKQVYACAQRASGWYGTLTIVAAFSGLRMGELRDLRWGDIDFKGEFIHVRHNFVLGHEDTPKSHKVRSVPLTEQAADALREHKSRCGSPKSDDLVFPNLRGRHFDDSKARKEFKSACKSAGLPEVRFHDLRHTFGTMAVNVYPLSAVQAYMGHSDIKTTMIYVHHQARTEDSRKLSDHISALL